METNAPTSPVRATDPVPATAAPDVGAWLRGLLVAAVVLAGLNWLLARVVWLPFYFGVFFFLVAGLLAGGVAFRVARRARPLSRQTILVGVAGVTVLAAASGLYWEYRHVAATIGEPPRFGDAWTLAHQQGRPSGEVGRQATGAFRNYLGEQFAPGGAVGYVRWAVRSGRAKLTLPGGDVDTVSIGHRRIPWIIRTIAAYILTAAGLWSQFDSLRSATPTTNLLAPGEEATDEE